MSMSQAPSAPLKASLSDYLRIARFDHATKHVFIIPGIVFAIVLRNAVPVDLWRNMLAGFAAAVCLASGNYVINEWLDRSFDRYHPEKSQRAAVQRELDPRIVYGMYAALVVVGLLLASRVNAAFFATSVVFSLAGLAYNVQPVRTKDRLYLDVLSESINNAIRLTLGWTMVDGATLPPASLLLAFWMGGAFLMNSKRLAEYRDIVAEVGKETLGLYRRSFRFYDEQKLLVANLVYALLCGFFLAVFLVKYRSEYVLLVPFVTVLFSEYFRLSLSPNSVARKPELLFKERWLMLFSVLTGVAFLILTFVDLPWMHWVVEPHFIRLGRP